MLAFTYTQRGEIPVEPVKRAIVDAHQRGVVMFLNEITKNLSGRVVNPGRTPHPRRLTLRAALRAITVQSQAGETASQIGFASGKTGAAHIARFLERGTAAHWIMPFKRVRGLRHLRAGQGRGKDFGPVKRALSFLWGGRVFYRRVLNLGIEPRPILGRAFEIAAPVIVEDYKKSLDAALHG